MDEQCGQSKTILSSRILYSISLSNGLEAVLAKEHLGRHQYTSTSYTQIPPSVSSLCLNQQHACYWPSQDFSQGDRLSSTFLNKLPLRAYSVIVKADGTGAIMVTTDFLTKTTGAIILLLSWMHAHHLKFQAHTCVFLIEKHPGLPTEYDEVGYAQFFGSSRMFIINKSVFKKYIGTWLLIILMYQNRNVDT